MAFVSKWLSLIAIHRNLQRWWPLEKAICASILASWGNRPCCAHRSMQPLPTAMADNRPARAAERDAALGGLTSGSGSGLRTQHFGHHPIWHRVQPQAAPQRGAGQLDQLPPQPLRPPAGGRRSGSSGLPERAREGGYAVGRTKAIGEHAKRGAGGGAGSPLRGPRPLDCCLDRPDPSPFKPEGRTGAAVRHRLRSRLRLPAAVAALDQAVSGKSATRALLVGASRPTKTPEAALEARCGGRDRQTAVVTVRTRLPRMGEAYRSAVRRRLRSSFCRRGAPTPAIRVFKSKILSVLPELRLVNLALWRTSALPTRPKSAEFASRLKVSREKPRAKTENNLDPAILTIIINLARADARRDHRSAARDAAAGEKADRPLPRRG
jgi:hypothetical protein